MNLKVVRKRTILNTNYWNTLCFVKRARLPSFTTSCRWIIHTVNEVYLRNYVVNYLVLLQWFKIDQTDAALNKVYQWRKNWTKAWFNRRPSKQYKLFTIYSSMSLLLECITQGTYWVEKSSNSFKLVNVLHSASCYYQKWNDWNSTSVSGAFPETARYYKVSTD